MGKCTPVALAITETTKEWFPPISSYVRAKLTTSLRLFSITVGTRHGDKLCKRLHIFVIHWVMEAMLNFAYSTIYLEMTLAGNFIVFAGVRRQERKNEASEASHLSHARRGTTQHHVTNERDNDAFYTN